MARHAPHRMTRLSSLTRYQSGSLAAIVAIGTSAFGRMCRKRRRSGRASGPRHAPRTARECSAFVPTCGEHTARTEFVKSSPEMLDWSVRPSGIRCVMVDVANHLARAIAPERRAHHLPDQSTSRMCAFALHARTPATKPFGASRRPTPCYGLAALSPGFLSRISAITSCDSAKTSQAFRASGDCAASALSRACLARLR
jgi:hypothetical protein